MEVHLVGVQTIDRLFEAQSDSDLHKTILLLALGGLIGFLTNIVTSSDFEWSAVAYTYIAATVAIVLAFAALSIRSQRRLPATARASTSRRCVTGPAFHVRRQIDRDGYVHLRLTAHPKLTLLF